MLGRSKEKSFCWDLQENVASDKQSVKSWLILKGFHGDMLGQAWSYMLRWCSPHHDVDGFKPRTLPLTLWESSGLSIV